MRCDEVLRLGEEAVKTGEEIARKLEKIEIMIDKLLVERKMFLMSLRQIKALSTWDESGDTESDIDTFASIQSIAHDAIEAAKEPANA